MASSYPYPVFFECPGLEGDQFRKLENYFQIRRKSGGGDCGPVTNVNEKVYSVAFKEQEAQQRVLQRKEHVVELPLSSLVLTVLGSHSSSSVTSSTPDLSVNAKQDFSSFKKQQSKPASDVPPSGEEYELQLDGYLLSYFKECHQAGKELEDELASMSCFAQLYPDEGRVLLRRLTQPVSVEDGSNWKADADKLFDRYLCHYEVNPCSIKALLQSCSSDQITDGVKVYTEGAMAVVVGKHSQVKARLTDIEDLTVKRRESRLSEKKTRSRRLGDAKLRLLWKEIERDLGQNFPDVKVTQGDSGQVVLEGSAEDILEAGDWISEKEKLVSEMTVPNMSPQLLAFIRKAYEGPEMLRDFLGVGDEVEVELRDTELRLFSLSADKLDDAEKKGQEKFKEVNIDVPTCSTVPPELREKLKFMTNKMNQGQHRADVLFGSDSTICLLGHTKDVEELNETVIEFILDQSSIQGKVTLPYPELVQHLPELLQLHKFDYSGVTLHPLTSSSGPLVMLEGASSKVTEVKTRLGQFLDSLVQGRVAINLPGAMCYFESPSGRENILNVALSHKCLIQLQEQPHSKNRQHLASGVTLNNGVRMVASYRLCDGLQVLVCQGDITKQEADALVNAANEDLDHGGGVAAALSKAGGPDVQRESKMIVKHNGKIPTSDVVVTTGGNLKCKKLLHAVGPVAGKAHGRERFLLEKTVRSALNLAEAMEFKSIALPCISSGLFGVPIPVCTEAIVTAVKQFGSQGGRSLSKIILIDNRLEVVKAMQEACDRLFQGISTIKGTPSRITAGHKTGDIDFQMDADAQDAARGATAGAPGNGVHIEIVQGAIETQQVDGLVSPMVGHDPLSTRVGHVLSNMVGPQLTAKFHQNAGGASLPGDIVLVDGLPALRWKAVIFLNLLSWDNNQLGAAVQALRHCIKKILTSCENKGYRSVALPVIGTGAVLRFPHNTASRVLLEEIHAFQQNRTSRSSFVVRVVIHPMDKESSKAFQSAQQTLHVRGFTNNANPGHATFYRDVSLTNDEVTAMLGAVKLQIVRGDIVNEGTDVIVNTTDFSTNQIGVSKAILTAAGPTVVAELAQVGIPADLMCTTGPGMLGCREIIHASFKGESQLIRKNCKKILKQCESKGFHSVAFPAINTGKAGMDPAKAGKAILDGIASAIADLKPKSLSVIRIVVLQQHIFQAFSSELENRFGQVAPLPVSLKDKALHKLKKYLDRSSRASVSSTPQGKTSITSKPEPAMISVICCCPDVSETIKRDLEEILQKQLIEREVKAHDFFQLDAMALEAVQSKIKVLGVSVDLKRCQSSARVAGNGAGNAAKAEARDQSESGEEVYVLRGLKEDVLSITELVSRTVQETLYQDLQDKEEALMALHVQWSIQDLNGVWQELNLHDNFMLEHAHMTNNAFENVTAPDGSIVQVNLKTNEATHMQTGVTYKIKRNVPAATIQLPEQWEPMGDDVVFKKVELQPNSEEYKTVAKDFHKTTKNNIVKIERVQNLYLWHAYSVCKQRILAKNGPSELREKSLYHGTSAKSCSCIEKDRFDRSYAGKHAARYGKGVYFAVNASYSAGGYSPPDASGLKRVYVACVLTGRYTVGKSEMASTPPRGTDPTDCYDSLVDNQQNPSMFVIFHDDQAYPKYLITFR